MVVWPPAKTENFPASRLVSLTRHGVAAHLSKFEFRHVQWQEALQMRHATKAKAKRVVNRLRRVLHPDKGAEDSVACACALRVVNAAYEVCPPASPIPQGLPLLSPPFQASASRPFSYSGAPSRTQTLFV